MLECISTDVLYYHIVPYIRKSSAVAITAYQSCEPVLVILLSNTSISYERFRARLGDNPYPGFTGVMVNRLGFSSIGPWVKEWYRNGIVYEFRMYDTHPSDDDTKKCCLIS